MLFCWFLSNKHPTEGFVNERNECRPERVSFNNDKNECENVNICIFSLDSVSSFNYLNCPLVGTR